MSYPMTDVISGRPASAAPAIQTTARRNFRASLRARCAIIVPVGNQPPEHSHLFIEQHAIRRTLLEPGEMVSIYRSRVRPDGIPQSAYYRVIADPTRQLPVSEAEVAELMRLSHYDDRLAALLGVYDDPAEVVRRERGDLSTLGWWDSPYSLTWADAAERGIESLSTEHLYCGVREVHGRWEAYRGLGGMLIVEAVTDTREEAVAIATASLWSAWLKRVREITERRLGDLSWGEPIGCPVSLPLRQSEMGDPQSRYSVGQPV